MVLEFVAIWRKREDDPISFLEYCGSDRENRMIRKSKKDWIYATMYSVCGIFYNMGAFCKKLSWIKEYCSKLPLTMGIKYEKINVKKDSASLADKKF